MKRLQLLYFSTSLCLLLFVHHQIIACDNKENVGNVLTSIAPSLDEIAITYLSQTFDQEEIKRYESKAHDPRDSFPNTVFILWLSAESCAQELLSAGLMVADVESLVIRTLPLLTKPLDPFLLYALLDALYAPFEPDSEGFRSKRAFTVMARLALNAPFSHFTENSRKLRSSSFAFFGYCASWSNDLLLQADNERLVDFWQIYFIDSCYPSALPWLLSLYDFYMREAQYLHTINDPLSDDNWPTLKAKLLSPDRFYDEEWLASYDVYNCQSSSFDFFASLPEYLIKDLNIYWHLLPKIVDAPKSKQIDFFQTMVVAGANPDTTMDATGMTAVIFANQLGLGHFLGHAPAKALMKKQHTQEMSPKKMTGKSCREPLSPVDPNTKRICLREQQSIAVPSTFRLTNTKLSPGLFECLETLDDSDSDL